MSISGKKRISPGAIIYQSKNWVVDHAYPVGVEGWLVIVAKRHVIALHELNSKEWAELGKIQSVLVGGFRSLLNAKKEYIACFSEAPGFSHIHFHIIPRTDNLPEAMLGSKVFQMLKPEIIPIKKERVIKVCRMFKKLFESYVKKP